MIHEVYNLNQLNSGKNLCSPVALFNSHSDFLERAPNHLDFIIIGYKSSYLTHNVHNFVNPHG